MNKLREALHSVQIIAAISAVLVGVVVSLTRTAMKVDAGEAKVGKLETRMELMDKQNSYDHAAIRESLIQIRMQLGYISDGISSISNRITHLERKP